MKKHILFCYWACITCTAKIKYNLILLNHYFHSIFISSNTVIGNNYCLLHHVTIGSNKPLSNDAPVINDNVFIGCNPCIIGQTIITENCIESLKS